MTKFLKSFLVAGLFLAGAAVTANPTPYAVVVAAEEVTVTVQNDTDKPFAWVAGSQNGTIEAGKTATLKVEAGTVLQHDGKTIVTIGKEHNGQTVQVSKLLAGNK